MGYIENVHKENKKRITRYGLKEGLVLEYNTTKEIFTIDMIHPLYGWVTTKPYKLKQDMSNINDFRIINKG